jgi:hypothetical protein
MVKIDQIIAVSGKPGLFKLIASKTNGLILEDLANGKANFYSSRTSQFSPLESIGIYTLADNIPLKDVYEKFLVKESTGSIPDDKTPDPAYKQFFEDTLPEYDRYRVHVRDMKKCVKWYHLLKQYGYIHASKTSDAKSEEE